MVIYCQARSPAGPSLVRRCQLLNDVGCALVYLHSLDPIVVHGDIKGDNVLVAGSPDHVQAKPTDFGLSRLARHACPDGSCPTELFKAKCVSE